MKQNIIMSSVGRCGASWVCGVISEIHRQIYGETIEWNWGISRYIATTTKYYFPEGFNQVLYINPLNLLKVPCHLLYIYIYSLVCLRIDKRIVVFWQ